MSGINGAQFNFEVGPVNSTRMVVTAAVLLALASCSSGFSVNRAKAAKVAELQALHRVDALDHLCYFGSDKDWHYIAHSQKFAGASYKVARAELSIAVEIPFVRGIVNKCSLMSGAFVPAGSGGYRYSNDLNSH